MSKHLRRLTCLALLTRACTILVQFASNVAIIDHRNDGFVTPALDIPRSAFDDYVLLVLGGFLQWDAHYFMNVAVYGYAFEKTLAFFPGFPLCVRLVGAVLQPFCQPHLNIVSVYLIAAVLMNACFFVLATRSLYRLSHKVLNDHKSAFLAAALFTVNPATVFFTAMYSEALFAYLSFQVMLADNVWISSVYAALSASVRSNGIVNLGFPSYRLVKRFANRSLSCASALSLACKLLLVASISVSLFVGYQLYCYASFCALYPVDFDEGILRKAAEKSLILRGRVVSDMCAAPVPYFYVQNRYWDVGFLKYFLFEQLPNFALACPILYLSIKGGLGYFAQNARLIPTLALKSRSTDANVFPYAVHLIFLVVSCLGFVHIQVSTRLLCSSTPSVYWFAAAFFRDRRKSDQRVHVFGVPLNLHIIILWYFLSYSVFGTILFSNAFPWT